MIDVDLKCSPEGAPALAQLGILGVMPRYLSPRVVKVDGGYVVAASNAVSNSIENEPLIVCGIELSPPKKDVSFVARVDHSGVCSWVKTVTTSAGAPSTPELATNGEHLFLLLQSDKTGVEVQKFSMEGDLISSTPTSLNNLYVRAISASPSGDLGIIGSSYDQHHNSFFTISDQGNVSITHGVGDIFNSVASAEPGAFVVAAMGSIGKTKGGKLLWSRPALASGEFHKIAVAPSGDILVAGRGTLPVGIGSLSDERHGFIARLTPQGELLWERPLVAHWGGFGGSLYRIQILTIDVTADDRTAIVGYWSGDTFRAGNELSGGGCKKDTAKGFFLELAPDGTVLRERADFDLEGIAASSSDNGLLSPLSQPVRLVGGLDGDRFRGLLTDTIAYSFLIPSPIALTIEPGAPGPAGAAPVWSPPKPFDPTAAPQGVRLSIPRSTPISLGQDGALTVSRHVLPTPAPFGPTPSCNSPLDATAKGVLQIGADGVCRWSRYLPWFRGQANKDGDIVGFTGYSFFLPTEPVMEAVSGCYSSVPPSCDTLISALGPDGYFKAARGVEGEKWRVNDSGNLIWTLIEGKTVVKDAATGQDVTTVPFALFPRVGASGHVIDKANGSQPFQIVAPSGASVFVDAIASSVSTSLDLTSTGAALLYVGHPDNGPDFGFGPRFEPGVVKIDEAGAVSWDAPVFDNDNVLVMDPFQDRWIFLSKYRLPPGVKWQSLWGKNPKVCPGCTTFVEVAQDGTLTPRGELPIYLSSFNDQSRYFFRGDWVAMPVKEPFCPDYFECFHSISVHLSELAPPVFEGFDGGVPGCKPKTCGEMGRNCGDTDDGCGQSINCGSCAQPFSCGAVPGFPNLCGCEPGSFSCSDAGELRQCSASGSTTVFVALCPQGACNAAAGLCDSCTPGGYYCSGQQRYLCDPGGSSGSPQGAPCGASQICDPATATCDACAPLSYLCIGANLRLCDPDGTKASLVSTCDSPKLCQQGMFLGSCPPPLCQPGEVRCLGDLAQTCNNDLDGWSTVEQCASAAHCGKITPGVCAP